MKQHTYLNFPLYKQTGLPTGSTFLLDAFNQLHSTVWFYCFIILGILSILFFNIYLQQKLQLENFSLLYNDNKLRIQPLSYVNPYIVYDNWLIELIILLIPCLIVILICLPSTALSYSTGEIHNASASLKITGEQWAWYNDVTIPVTNGFGYQKELFNQVTRFLKIWNSVNHFTNWPNYNFNFYFYPVVKQAYLYFAVSKDHIYDPTINHLVWINLKFLQTKLPLFNNYIAEKLNLNPQERDQVLKWAHVYIDNMHASVNQDEVEWLQGVITHANFYQFLESLINVNTWQYWIPGDSLFNFNQVMPFLPKYYYINLPLTNIATPIPAMVWTKLTVDSIDVIHSFWIWDYGVKLDCIPGNPLQTYIFPKKFGISTGNCAEYCGNGHINMPILIKSYDLTEPIRRFTLYKHRRN